MERIRTMAEGDFLVVATDGALVKVMESTRDAWQSVPQMGGGGWVIGIALKGTNVELPGVGRIEWVAGGRCGKDPAHELGGQGVLVPGGVRRHGGGNARTHPSFYEPVARLASSEKHRVRLRRRRRGSRRTGTTN